MTVENPAHITVDGNEAAALIAHKLSEVIAIYPITPASPMGELADAWSLAGKTNLWGVVPDVVEMQSEGGAAGAVHGSLQAGALTTTFTASQGLLLMIPNMYKIAGELTPAVIHVAARTVATHALSIFGDHSDVMAARQTGFAMLASNSVQEAHDMAVVAHLSTLEARIPFLHFFDGFRTSHEVAKISPVTDEMLRSLVDEDLIAQHRLRALNPNAPVLRGSAQNPDVFFQAREAANPFYEAVPGIVQHSMDAFSELTGRSYGLFEYHGDPEAEDVVVLMGSGVGAAREAVQSLAEQGEKVGVVVVRLYRPFDTAAFAATLPGSVRRIAVLDRTKEPGAVGDPLYLDVVGALAELGIESDVYSGRFGLSSKEFTPAMVAGVLDEIRSPRPRRHFTVGIVDDVSGLSIDYDPTRFKEPDDVTRAVFYGLGSDGTVGANKNSVKIIGEATDLFAQGYFVYDSKKSGSRTVSHVRVSPRPIHSTYLIDEADFVAVHQFDLAGSTPAFEIAGQGATVLLNSPYGPDRTWSHLPAAAQQAVIEKDLQLWAVDALAIARDAGLGLRVNTVLQTCFFHLTDLLPTDTAVEEIKRHIEKTYGKRGDVVVRRNEEAVDRAISGLYRVTPGDASEVQVVPTIPEIAPDFVKRVTAMMMDGRGDLLPVSALPVDGTFPTGTAKWEKRSIAHEIPIWDPDICIDCGRCALACPHAAIRLKAFDAGLSTPEGFQSKEPTGRDFDGMRVVVQVAPDDCTGCGVCVDICPAHSKEVAKHKAINMEPIADHLEVERRNFSYFLEIPETDRSKLKPATVKGSQFLEPLFEFSGACAGCGETPYLKLVTQMMGDRVVVANATGCSSIYGGNLPTTPWTVNSEGRGPAWSNSLFEDNAEFGLGMRLAQEAQREDALLLVTALAPEIGVDLAQQILETAAEPDRADPDSLIAKQRGQVETLKAILADLDGPLPRRLEGVADALIDTSVWIVGGDGWAYDIGFGGLDHVLASGRNINILVLDTEVYSNTGGQASKATPRAAIAKFAAGGKKTGKKDLGQIAMSYGNVYVAQIAMGANPTQTVRAIAEAEAHQGVSLIIAYSPCIAHGIEMSTQMSHQKEATDSGYWPLYRYDPSREAAGDPGLRLDSRKPTIKFKQFASKEARFAMLARANPDQAEELMAQAQQDIDDRWHFYEQMVTIHRTAEYAEVDE